MACPHRKYGLDSADEQQTAAEGFSGAESFVEDLSKRIGFIYCQYPGEIQCAVSNRFGLAGG